MAIKYNAPDMFNYRLLEIFKLHYIRNILYFPILFEKISNMRTIQFYEIVNSKDNKKS